MTQYGLDLFEQTMNQTCLDNGFDGVLIVINSMIDADMYMYTNLSRFPKYDHHFDYNHT